MAKVFDFIATVSVIVKCQNKYLFVEEINKEGKHIFNTPAGHLEGHESPLEGAMRELKEESGLTPKNLDGFVGFYSYLKKDYTLLRSCFYLEYQEFPKVCPNDPDGDIIATHWFTFDEITKLKNQMRSEMIYDSILDFEKGQRFPLSLLKNYEHLNDNL